MIRVTEDDRRTYRGYPDHTIIGIKIIKKLPTNMLVNALSKPQYHEAICVAIGEVVGGVPDSAWVTSRIAEELYGVRHAITGADYDRITRYL